jgi:acyl-CoA synthetase (AMP-forming)/AMP-acid ligase II
MDKTSIDASASLDFSAPTIGALLERRAQDWPQQVLFRHGGKNLNCSDANAQTNRLANALSTLGVKQGDPVAVMLPNGFEFPITWFAIAKLGAVIVPLNPAGGAHDLSHILSDSGAMILVSNDEGIKKLNGFNTPATASIHSVTWSASHADGSACLPTLMQSQSDQFIIDQSVTSDTLLNLQYTSGTTGSPKGCMLTHAYWLALASRSAKLIEATRSDVVFTCQPFYYMDPQWNTALCLSIGIPLVIADRFSASTFWQTINDEGITFFYCIGTMPVILFKLPPNPLIEQKHKLRAVYCSGIYPQLHQQFEERYGAPWREVFGMTETGVDLAMPIAATQSVGSGLVGYPVPGKEAAIVDSHDVALTNGEVGELVLRGGPMMKGYWNQPEATANIFRNGWLHTGDLARQEKSGAIQLVGRLKDMVRRAGENIAAVEVEEVLCTHPSVMQAAVTPTPDETLGEEVMAWIRLQVPDTQASDEGLLEDIRMHATKRLAQFKVPRYWFVVTEFPLTPSERVAKHRLREFFPMAEQHRTDFGSKRKG